ncbi:class IV adenylate cyclase [bacterium]|nr:MAG: class IV adenylate cyclase [bacterium]
MIEIEVKIRIEDPSEMKRKLIALGCVVTMERFLERNAFYDFRAGDLLAKKEALRLRTIGKRSWLTFKGPAQGSRSFKVREEFESEVRNAPQLRKILKALGLQPTFQYRKKRAHLRKGRLKICLDETSVGNFIELEGKRNEIVKFAKALGHSRADFITRDYVQMIRSAERDRIRS